MAKAIAIADRPRNMAPHGQARLQHYASYVGKNEKLYYVSDSLQCIGRESISK